MAPEELMGRARNLVIYKLGLGAEKDTIVCSLSCYLVNNYMYIFSEVGELVHDMHNTTGMQDLCIGSSIYTYKVDLCGYLR